MSQNDEAAVTPENLALRAGLPQDLRHLLARYPRDVWQDHANLGDMARFWMSRHDMFRELGHVLGTASADLAAGRIKAEGYARWFAPRLQFLLSHLSTHHQIEDHHYFPIFRAAEARIARGFDLLEADHHDIHAAMDEALRAARVLLQALDRGSGDLRAPAEAYVAAGDPLVALLLRHLDDEEDLIVPLILDRGEASLGVGH